MTHTTEEVQRFIELRSRSWSFDKISVETGISKPTLLKMNTQYRKEIKLNEFFEYQNLVEQMGIMRKDRFELYSKMLSSVKQELQKRMENQSLEGISTEKLVELSMRLEERLLKDINKPLVSVQSDYDFELSLGEPVPFD